LLHNLVMRKHKVCTILQAIKYATLHYTIYKGICDVEAIKSHGKRTDAKQGKGS